MDHYDNDFDKYKKYKAKYLLLKERKQSGGLKESCTDITRINSDMVNKLKEIAKEVNTFIYRLDDCSKQFEYVRDNIDKMDKSNTLYKIKCEFKDDNMKVPRTKTFTCDKKIKDKIFNFSTIFITCINKMKQNFDTVKVIEHANGLSLQLNTDPMPILIKSDNCQEFFEFDNKNYYIFVQNILQQYVNFIQLLYSQLKLNNIPYFTFLLNCDNPKAHKYMCIECMVGSAQLITRFALLLTELISLADKCCAMPPDITEYKTQYLNFANTYNNTLRLLANYNKSIVGYDVVTVDLGTHIFEIGSTDDEPPEYLPPVYVPEQGSIVPVQMVVAPIPIITGPIVPVQIVTGPVPEKQHVHNKKISPLFHKPEVSLIQQLKNPLSNHPSVTPLKSPFTSTVKKLSPKKLSPFSKKISPKHKVSPQKSPSVTPLTGSFTHKRKSSKTLSPISSSNKKMSPIQQLKRPIHEHPSFAPLSRPFSEHIKKSPKHTIKEGHMTHPSMALFPKPKTSPREQLKRPVHKHPSVTPLTGSFTHKQKSPQKLSPISTSNKKMSPMQQLKRPVREHPSFVPLSRPFSEHIKKSPKHTIKEGHMTHPSVALFP